jgi:hypothetical protein
VKLFFIPVLLLVFSCSGALDESEYLFNIDLKPPVLQKVNITNSSTLTIEFNEPVDFCDSDYTCDPDLPLKSWSVSDNMLTLRFEQDQEAGLMYKFRSDVSDNSGNSLSFIVRYYGWNPDIPVLLINEFNPEGSGNNPDTIEIYSETGGNMAGVALILGTADHISESYVLPSLNVEAGDYIIVHMRPEGLSEEINEFDDKAVSGGKLSSDQAWDLWVDGDKPISGKNGVITLYSNLFGEILDAVPYSNRLTADSEDYHGWTSTTIEMIEELSYLNVWYKTNDFIRPEDAVYSEGTTGTRSICRDSASSDTDKRDDWHIVPTGEKSFGQINSDNVYAP